MRSIGHPKLIQGVLGDTSTDKVWNGYDLDVHEEIKEPSMLLRIHWKNNEALKKFQLFDTK